jgi:hypothetical protein
MERSRAIAVCGLQGKIIQPTTLLEEIRAYGEVKTQGSRGTTKERSLAYFG